MPIDTRAILSPFLCFFKCFTRPQILNQPVSLPDSYFQKRRVLLSSTCSESLNLYETFAIAIIVKLFNVHMYNPRTDFGYTRAAGNATNNLFRFHSVAAPSKKLHGLMLLLSKKKSSSRRAESTTEWSHREVPQTDPLTARYFAPNNIGKIRCFWVRNTGLLTGLLTGLFAGASKIQNFTSHHKWREITARRRKNEIGIYCVSCHNCRTSFCQYCWFLFAPSSWCIVTKNWNTMYVFESVFCQARRRETIMPSILTLSQLHVFRTASVVALRHGCFFVRGHIFFAEYEAIDTTSMFCYRSTAPDFGTILQDSKKH